MASSPINPRARVGRRPLQPGAPKPSAPVATGQVDSGPAPDAWVESRPRERTRGRAPNGGGANLDVAVRALESGAQRANIRHALVALQNMGGAVGKAATLLLTRPEPVPAPLPASTDIEGLRHAVAAAIGSVATDELGKQAFARLLGALTAFRAGATRPVIFGVEHVALPDPLPRPPAVEARVGFDPAVDGMRLDEDHSIGDLQHYVDQRFGRFALEDIVANGRSIELHHGGRDETMASLAARGFERCVRVRTPEAVLHNELYLFENPKTGELRYVMTEIWGGTRLGHVQKLLKAAVVDVGAGPRGLRPEQVEVYTEPLRRPEDIYRRTSRALLASGTVPASVVVGFKASVLKELGRRAAQAKQLEHVQRALGNDPVATLRARAAEAGASGAPLMRALDGLGEDAAVLKLPPSEVFRFEARLAALRTAETALAGVLREHPGTAALLDDVVSANGFKVVVAGRVADRIPEGTFIDQTVVTYFDQEGAPRSLLLTRNPYGEVAHEVGRVLVDQGVDNVFVFGTAGGLKEGDQVGDIHAPTEVVHSKGPLPFDNRAIEIATTIPALLRAPMRQGTRVANVGSPVDETLSTVAKLRSEGADIVEMELSHLATALRGTDVRLSAVYLVSDLPGTDKTIEKQAHLELDRSLAKAVDVLIEGLGMRGVLLETDPKPPVLSPFAGAMELAGRALTRRGMDPEGHALQRYVVARYLFNGFSDKAIASLLRDSKQDPIDNAQLSPRWREKALRELAKPYADRGVVAHLRALNAELADAVREIRQLGGNTSDFAVHILGSVVKGRAGIGSDVDTLIETRDEALAERVFQSRFGYKGAPAERNVVIGGHGYVMTRGEHYGPLVNLGDGQRVLDDPDALLRVWADAAKKYGVLLEGSGDAVQVRIDPDVLADAVAERDTQPIAERLLEHEKTFRKSIETDFLLRHLRNTAPLADITAVPLERMVHAGELLIRTRLATSLTVDKLTAILQSPLGEQKLSSPAGRAFLAAAGCADGAAVIERLRAADIRDLPLGTLIDGELAAALMDVGDPYDVLTVDLAAANRVRLAHEAAGDAWQKPELFPFFAREVKRAQVRARSGSPLSTRLGD